MTQLLTTDEIEARRLQKVTASHDRDASALVDAIAAEVETLKTAGDEDGLQRLGRDTPTLLQFQRDLLDGTVFRRHAASAASVRGYQPPASARDYGHVIETLGRMAREGDLHAQVAQGIIAAGLPLYQTPFELAAKVWDHAWSIVSSGTWDDVHARSGPEPCRHSDAQRPFTIHQVLSILVWVTEATAPISGSVPGLGWVASALIRLHRANVPQGTKTPALTAAAERAAKARR